MNKEMRNWEPMGVDGYDSRGIKRKMYLFPKDAPVDEIYWMMMEVKWKTIDEKASTENKSLFQVVREIRLRRAKNNNEEIDIEKVLMQEMKQYQSLQDYKSKNKCMDRMGEF